MTISIEIILTILIAIIMITSIVWGIIQGFRKNLYRLITTILFWCVFFITAPLLAKSPIWTSTDFYNRLPLDPAYDSIIEFAKGQIAIQLKLDPSLLADPAVEGTLIAACLSIIRIVYLLILAIFYNIITSIIYAVFFAPTCKVSKGYVRKLKRKTMVQKKKKGKVDKKLERRLAVAEKNLKAKKVSRLVGMGTGFLRGALSSFMILALVNSLFAMIPELKRADETASTDGETTHVVSIYDYIVGKFPEYKEVIDYIADYQESNLSTATSIKINGQSLDTLLIDAILTGKSGNYTFSIRKELQQVMKIASYAYTLTNGFDMQNFDYYNLDESQIELVQNILYILAEDDLVKNLGSVAVGLALTMDQVKDKIPTDMIDVSMYNNIDWTNELKTVADLVASVYGLGDLKNIDFMQIPETNFTSLLSGLSNLQSIQLIGTIGSYIGFQSANLPEEQMADIKQKLADVVWSEDIGSIGDLYNEYVNLATYYSSITPEEGETFNLLSFIGGAPTGDVQSVFDTILETSFIEAVLPNVLTIVKEKIPSEYRSLINPNVLLSTQWKQELNTVLSMLKVLQKDGTVNPFDNIKQFDFSTLSKISTDTILSSELLSYAVISCVVSGSNGTGMTAALGNYIMVPDHLKTYNEETHSYSSDWYGVDGELYVVFDTLKNVASKIEDSTYLASSFTAMFKSIDVNRLLSSDVLYCTFDKLLKTTDQIVIPNNVLTTTGDIKVNNETLSMISKNEISNVVNVLCGEDNLIDLEKIYAYVWTGENNVEHVSPEKPKDPNQNYIVKLDIRGGKILNLLKSEKIYSEVKGIDNTAKMFKSSILRATVSNFLEGMKPTIAVPSSLSNLAKTDELIYNPTDKVYVDENKKLSVLSALELGNLVKAFNTIDIDVANLLSDPLSLLDSFKEETKVDGVPSITYRKEVVENIFSRSKQATYSELLHATISQYVNDLSNQSGDSLKIIIPSSVVEENTSYITSDEIVNLVKALVYVDVEKMLGSNAQDSIADEILNNDQIGEAFDSVIFRATITQYVNNTNMILIPNSEKVMEGEEEVISAKSIKDLIKTVKALKINDLNNVLSDPLSILDCFKNEDGSFNQNLAESIFMENGANYSSILHATLSSQLTTFNLSSDFELVIPSTAYSASKYDEENYYLDGSEVVNALKAVCYVKDDFDAIQDGTQTMNQVIDNLLKEESDLQYTYDSIIFRASITKYLKSIDESIIIPTQAMDTSVSTSTVDVIKISELKALINAISTFDLSLDELKDASNIDIMSKFEKEGKFNEFGVRGVFVNSSGNENYSSILHAFISSYVQDYDMGNVFSIVIPDPLWTEEYADGKKFLDGNEVVNVIKALYTVKEDFDTIGVTQTTEEVIDGLIASEKILSTFDSMIFRASTTKYLESLGNMLVIPSSTYEIIGSDNVIKADDFNRLIHTINLLDISISTIGNDPLSAVDAFKNNDGSFNRALAEQLFVRTSNDYSSILYATLSTHIDNYATTSQTSNFKIIVLSSLKESDGYLQSVEMINLIQSFVYVNIDALTNSTTDTSTLVNDYLNDTHFEDMIASTIFRATMSNYIVSMGEDGSIVIPEDNHVRVLYEENQTTIAVLTIDELVKLKTSIVTLGSIDDISNLNNLSVSHIAENKEIIFNSLIMKATISKYINDLTTPNSGIQMIIPEDVYTSPYIKDEELYAFIDAIAIVCPDNLSNINGFSQSDLASINRQSVETFFSSKIIVATTSPLVYDELIAAKIMVPEPYTRDDLTKEELVAVYTAMDVLLGSGQSIANADISYTSIMNGTLFDTSSEDKILLLCKSDIISYNMVHHIKEENTNTLGDVLKLDCHRDGSEIKWYYESDTAKGELYELLLALHYLQANGFYSALNENVNSTSLSTFKSEGFITTLTGNQILCDSIPNIMNNFKSCIESGNNFINIDAIYVNENGDQSYWGGTPYTEGQLYKFFNAIESMNRLKAYTSATDSSSMKSDIEIIIDCDVTKAMVVDYLTKTELVSAMNSTQIRFLLGIPNDYPQLVVPTANAEGVIDWSTEDGQNYLTYFTTIYLTAVERGVSL